MTTAPPPHWAIGHDGSSGAAHATEWALTQARGRGVHLTLVRTWQIPALDFPVSVESTDAFAPTQACENVDEIIARAADGGVTVSQHIVSGAAASTLLEASADASLLVIGARGLGGFRRLLLGSISSQCATHAVVPTVVVPSAAATDRPIARLVVGLDGSERSQRALTWAVEFAPEGCAIVVVGAWMPSKSGFEAVAQHYTNELQRSRDRFNEILDAREAAAGSTLFERRFDFADPATTLLDAASRADLLVVGKRGHSGLSAAILGSVSTHVLHHSPVPVAIIPDEST